MSEKEIRVKYLYGIKQKDFLELKELGYGVDIPKEKKHLPAVAVGGQPEDYIIIFGIYFSLKVTEELAKGIAEKMTANFTNSIRNIWRELNVNKPAKLVSGRKPEYKLPKAILTFQISKDETTTLEITDDLSESELKKILDTQLELVKMKYKHRKAELKLKQSSKPKK